MNLLHQRLNYAAVGLFVLAMLAAGVVSLALLAGRGGARDGYFTVLDNVADVGFGSQVRYEGYPVGQVEKITPFADGARMRFRVELAIERGWRLPADSVARIGNTSVLSAKTLDIESGHSTSTIATGGEIPSGPPSDMFSAMAGLAADLGDLGRDGVVPLLDRIAVIVERAGAGLERDLAQLMGTLNRLAVNVEGRAPELVDRTAELIARLDASAAALQSVLSKENTRSVRSLMSNAEETSRIFAATSRDMAASMAKVDRLIVDLDDLVAGNRNGIDRSLKDIQHTLATIAQSVDSLVHNLDATSRNMNEFSRLIRQNPGLLLGGTPREEVSSRDSAIQGTKQ